jgi:hypothetical protein
MFASCSSFLACKLARQASWARVLAVVYESSAILLISVVREGSGGSRVEGSGIEAFVLVERGGEDVG